MKETELEHYKAGYWEARAVMIYRLKELIADGDDTEDLLETLEDEERQEMEEFYQKEAAALGITLDEHMAAINASAESLKNVYFNEDGTLKPRRPSLTLVKANKRHLE